jgi:hypothetical protein
MNLAAAAPGKGSTFGVFSSRFFVFLPPFAMAFKKQIHFSATPT